MGTARSGPLVRAAECREVGGGGAHRPFANGNQRVVCTNGFGITRRIAPGRCSAVIQWAAREEPSPPLDSSRRIEAELENTW